MAKIKFTTGESLKTIKFSVKNDSDHALDLYNQLSAAVHIGAAMQSQVDRLAVDVDRVTDQPILYFSSALYPLYYSDLTEYGLYLLKRSRLKLARKLGFTV